MKYSQIIDVLLKEVFTGAPDGGEVPLNSKFRMKRLNKNDQLDGSPSVDDSENIESAVEDIKLKPKSLVKINVKLSVCFYNIISICTSSN